MNKDTLQLALYEISISIGNSFDLKKMLDEAIRVMLSRLGCSAAAIYLIRKDIKSLRAVDDFELNYAKPKVLLKDPQGVKQINDLIEAYISEPKNFYQNQYLGDYYYLFELKNLGVLILRRFEHPFDDFVINALKKINLKLVSAIRACLDHKALHDSQSNLVKSQHIAQVGSWEQDLDTLKIIWSDETYKIVGVDKELFDHSTDAYFKIVHPKDTEHLSQVLQRAANDLKPFEIEYRLVMPGSQIKYVRVNGKGESNRNGRPTRLVGTIQDITQSKLISLALEQSEKKITELYQAFNDAIYVQEIVDDKVPGRFIEVNDVACEQLGYSKDELLTMTAMDIDLLGQDPNRELKFAEFIKTILDQSIIVFESIHITKEGVHIPVEVTGRVVKYQCQNVIMSIVRDISERKHNEEELLKASKVIANLAEGIMITDHNGLLLKVNPAFTRITGYSMEEVVGTKPQILTSGQHSSDFYKNMWREIKQNGSWKGEIWNRRKNGEIYPEWLSISSMFDSEGKALNYIGVFSDITAIKESEKELRFLAHHDPLTKLPNRILLNNRIERALERQDQIAVLFLDLDRFKTINDTFGHPHGDELLKQVAFRLKDVLRDYDTVSRVSGDEFVILLEKIESIEQVTLLAQRVISSISETFSLDEYEVRVTTSVGIAMSPDDGTEGVELLKKADTALYRAKDLGRNNFEFFSKEMSAFSFESLNMVNGLHSAVEKNEFILYFQPQVNTKENKLIGVEALIRWQHPELGLVSPAQFIHLAEESGMIVKIGEWVLRESALTMRRWLENKTPIEYVAVNISGRQLMDKHFYQMVAGVMDEVGIEGKYIELEVTETLVMKESNYSTLLNDLKKNLGLRISIDDFGTGYSSLTRLKDLPIDKLKIDMSFIRDLPIDEENATITESIINLAKGMKLEVIAEGVEKQVQVDFLKKHGCDHSQGYFFSQPLALDSFEKWVLETEKSLLFSANRSI